MVETLVFEVFNGERVVREVREDHVALRNAGSRALELIAESLIIDQGSWELQEWRVQVCNVDRLILLTIGGYAVHSAAAAEEADLAV